jgi:hypothetical protein
VGISIAIGVLQIWNNRRRGRSSEIQTVEDAEQELEEAEAEVSREDRETTAGAVEDADQAATKKE